MGMGIGMGRGGAKRGVARRRGNAPGAFPDADRGPTAGSAMLSWRVRSARIRFEPRPEGPQQQQVACAVRRRENRSSADQGLSAPRFGGVWPVPQRAQAAEEQRGRRGRRREAAEPRGVEEEGGGRADGGALAGWRRPRERGARSPGRRRPCGVEGRRTGVQDGLRRGRRTGVVARQPGWRQYEPAARTTTSRRAAASHTHTLLSCWLALAPHAAACTSRFCMRGAHGASGRPMVPWKGFLSRTLSLLLGK